MKGISLSVDSWVMRGQYRSSDQQWATDKDFIEFVIIKGDNLKKKLN